MVVPMVVELSSNQAIESERLKVLECFDFLILLISHFRFLDEIPGCFDDLPVHRIPYDTRPESTDRALKGR
jgi:hypothetical protein